jgi:hypothetical protein
VAADPLLTDGDVGSSGVLLEQAVASGINATTATTDTNVNFIGPVATAKLGQSSVCEDNSAFTWVASRWSYDVRQRLGSSSRAGKVTK